MFLVPFAVIQSHKLLQCEHTCRQNHPLLARAVLKMAQINASRDKCTRNLVVFFVMRNSVKFQNFHFSVSREMRVTSLKTRILYQETRLSSREKRDETGNLLLSSTVSAPLGSESKACPQKQFWYLLGTLRGLNPCPPPKKPKPARVSIHHIHGFISPQ